MHVQANGCQQQQPSAQAAPIFPAPANHSATARSVKTYAKTHQDQLSSCYRPPFRSSIKRALRDECQRAVRPRGDPAQRAANHPHTLAIPPIPPPIEVRRSTPPTYLCAAKVRTAPRCELAVPDVARSRCGEVSRLTGLGVNRRGRRAGSERRNFPGIAAAADGFSSQLARALITTIVTSSCGPSSANCRTSS